jgi:aminopeptidase N
VHTPHVRVLALTAFLLTACTATAPGDAAATTIPVRSTTATRGTDTIDTTAVPAPRQTTIAPEPTVAPFAVRDGIGDPVDPALGNTGYDVEHYDVDMTFDPAAHTLTSLVTITAAATSTLDTFNLDFVGYDITEVTVDGAPAAFDRIAEELTVAPGAAIPPGEDFVVAVSYTGSPAAVTSGTIGLKLGWNTVGAQNYVVAEPDAARSWFPCNDHPTDKSTYTFRLTVPDGITAAANGEHVDTITDVDSATWVWDMDEPMATYLATVVIGDFTIVPDDSGPDVGVTIRNVLPPDLAAAPPPALDEQAEMIQFLSERFGPYPFDEYGIAVVDGFDAALENQTLSVFGRGFAEAPGFDTVLVHEMAHQWFGDDVSVARWQDIWLNEGFATYAEWLWIESQTSSDFVSSAIEQERQYFASVTGLPPPGSPPADDLFNASVYRVGGMALHALRLTVGDDTFFDILRTYVERFGGANASTDDFIDVAAEVSGRDVRPLLESWVLGPTIPEFPQG